MHISIQNFVLNVHALVTLLVLAFQMRWLEMVFVMMRQTTFFAFLMALIAAYLLSIHHSALNVHAMVSLDTVPAPIKRVR